MMTFPRELEFKNGKLFQNPVRELLLYRKKCECGVVSGTSSFIKNGFSHGDIELEFFLLLKIQLTAKIKMKNFLLC